MNVQCAHTPAASKQELDTPRVDSRLHAKVYFYHCDACKHLAVSARDAYDDYHDVTVILERPYYLTI